MTAELSWHMQVCDLIEIKKKKFSEDNFYKIWIMSSWTLGDTRPWHQYRSLMDAMSFKRLNKKFMIHIWKCSKVNLHGQQCLKLSQKSCRSSCLESHIINIKLKKNQQKVVSPPPKLSASDWWTCGDFRYWWPVILYIFVFSFPYA